MAPTLLPNILKWLLAFAVVATLARADPSCNADTAHAVKSDALLQVTEGLKKVQARALTDSAASEQAGDEAEEEDDSNAELAGDAESGSRRRRRRRTTKLDNDDFRQGTYRITTSGKYRLKENIVFDPQRADQSWSAIPPDSVTYPQLAGYFLGFFAAVAIEADDVELDCRGKEIKMSVDFHKRQRFFSIIELGSSPFAAGQGPPQFASNYTTPVPPTFAKNVVIKNCRLGLSSHHSVHGNANVGVAIKNVQMYDFEVAGVALNGASNVALQSLNIGPSLKRTFGAGLSQAIFLDHLASTLMEDDPVVAPLKRSKTLKLRGQQYTAQSIFETLRTSLHTYVDNNHTGPMAAVAGHGHDLPDGSAVYGVLLHRAGVAIGRIGVCPDDNKDSVQLVKNIRLEDIHIFDLAVKVDQVVNYVVNGQIVAGPAGDVFQVTRAWKAADCHKYEGNVLMDAELAICALCEDLLGLLPTQEFKSFCGGCYMPGSVLAWASGDQSCQETQAWATSLTQGALASEQLTCLGDSMNHHNKGAIALRLGFQEDISVENVLVEDIVNHGVANAANCTVQNYEGVDVRAASIAHMKDMHEFSIKQKGELTGTDPRRVFPITGFLQMRGDDGLIQG